MKKTITDKEHLCGSEITDMGAFIKRIVGENRDFSAQTIEYLGRNYGTEYAAVLDIARKEKALGRSLNEDGEILAQVAYAVRNESAQTLNDILFRRTGIGTLGNPGEDVLRLVARTAAKELKWNAARVKKEIEKAREVFHIPGAGDPRVKTVKGKRRERHGKKSNAK